MFCRVNLCGLMHYWFVGRLPVYSGVVGNVQALEPTLEVGEFAIGKPEKEMR